MSVCGANRGRERKSSIVIPEPKSVRRTDGPGAPVTKNTVTSLELELKK